MSVKNMISKDWYYEYCPRFKKAIDLYMKMLYKSYQKEWMDWALYGEEMKNNIHVDDEDVNDFNELINKLDMDKCINSINVFKSFEKYDYW